MSILSDARQLLAETDQKIRDPALTATETAWVAINFADKMSVMLPEVLAYAEMREAQAIELKAKVDCPNYGELPEEDHVEKRYIGDKGDFHTLYYEGKRTLRQAAARELSADLPPRITEEEKAAIKNILKSSIREDANFTKIIVHNSDLEVLRGLL